MSLKIETVSLRQYQDARGSLTENSVPDIMKDSQHFFISKSKPGVIRGNHYHKRKSEWFYILQGSGEIIVEDIDTKERTSLLVRESDQLLVHMEPLKSHAFKNIGENEMILLALVNEPHNQADPDTYPYKIL